MTQRNTRKPRIIDTSTFDPILEAQQLAEQELARVESEEAAYQRYLEDRAWSVEMHRLYRPAFQQAVLRSEPAQGWDA